MSHLLETRRGMGIRRCARYARILLASIARASFTGFIGLEMIAVACLPFLRAAQHSRARSFRSALAITRLMVVPTERSTSGSAEWMASRAMGTMLKQIKRDYPSRIVILDLPPMLTRDDVLAILPQIDSAPLA
jgi:hypothetical protein